MIAEHMIDGNQGARIRSKWLIAKLIIKVARMTIQI